MRQVAPARTQTHARILLTRDAGTAGPRWSDARVAEAVEVSARTVARVRARFAARGVAAAPLWPRLELQDMPPHGSRLNLAEGELSALTRHGLDRRIPDQPTLQQEVSGWADDRNRAAVRIDWRFTVEDARSTVQHRSPVPDDAT